MSLKECYASPSGGKIWLFPGIGVTNDPEQARDWADSYTGSCYEMVNRVNEPEDIDEVLG